MLIHNHGLDHKKILYNNLVKTSQKSNSKISIFNKNKSNNKNNKKRRKKSKERCY